MLYIYVFLENVHFSTVCCTEYITINTRCIQHVPVKAFETKIRFFFVTKRNLILFLSIISFIFDDTLFILLTIGCGNRRDGDDDDYGW